ncbi:hypothetical protein EDB89DRAFT_425341 [Lactarius sanguifluus]|nr:hypothetical protein EDB89DRAFT_425341 [Lactarius sanguifluus]
MCQSNGTWAMACSLLTPTLFIMRSPILSVFFLALFALLFGAVCAAPIGSPNVSSKRSCILGRCENAGSTRPENALFKFLDVRSAILHLVHRDHHSCQ